MMDEGDEKLIAYGPSSAGSQAVNSIAVNSHCSGPAFLSAAILP